MNPLSSLGNLTSSFSQNLSHLTDALKAKANAKDGVPAELQELVSRPIARSDGASGGQATPSDFRGLLKGLVDEVGEKGAAAGAAIEGALSGQDVQLHQAMIAVEEASVSFQLMVEVRNRLLESYQELMRMQV